MISVYDVLNIVFYFLFIVGVGVYFSRRNRNTSDYFRGGGVLPWWVTGASTWMAGFTAWTFVGAAGKIHQTGPYVLVLYYQNVIPIIVLWGFTCYRFRRLRVITPMEALRLRFGPATQQFYTWIRLPIILVFGGFALNAVAVFMSAVFGVDLFTIILVLGVLVTLVSLLGGAMGVAASDFVQMLLIVLVAATVMVLALAHPAIGGFTGLLNRAPSAHFAWSEIARPEFIGLWFAMLTLNTLFGFNSLSDEKAAKYMMAESDRHARRTLIIPFLGTVFGSILWVVPPMAAAVLYPDLAARFPQLSNPEEAAFLVIARDVLPQGMLGLLICCIFAASLTDLGGHLNWSSGLLLRNFYLPVINPQCPEKRLMQLSRLGALGLGAVLVTFALLINHYRQQAAITGASWGLFDLLNQIGTSLGIPLALPACLGLFYKRTPAWSAWSTALIGLAMSYVALNFLRPEMVGWIPGLAGPYSVEEGKQFGVIATAALVTITAASWFLFTSLFYPSASPEYRASVDEFFTRLRTPLPDDPAAATRENQGFPIAIGRMCMIYGGFIALFAAIPNPAAGRACFLVCGGIMLLSGWALARYYTRLMARANGAATVT